MTRDELLREFPLLDYCRRELGMRFEKRESADELCDLCPFHQDKKPSFVVNVKKGVWFCQPCGIGGSVIDLHMRLHGMMPRDAIADLARKFTDNHQPIVARPGRAPVKIYDYTDERGQTVFQVCRFEPKDFRQRKPDGKGGWLWTMEGVMRVLYRLPAVLLAQEVFCCEGEKDSDTLSALGLAATCNVGGAGKWLAAYSDALQNKDVVIAPDNDEPGRKHADDVAKMLAEKANSIRVLTIPAPHKDVSDWLATIPEKEAALKAVRALVEKTPHLLKPLPIYTMEEMEMRYAKFARNGATRTFDLGKFAPTLGRHARPLVAGDLAVVMADTGQGKTVLLSSMARAARPLPTLIFELELPAEMMFERLAAMESGLTTDAVEKAYHDYGCLPPTNDLKRLSHILVCPESGLSIEQIERLIHRSELKGGERPVVVVVDYIGLVSATGTRSRYEAVSMVAEQLKVIAKKTETIVICGTQIARPDQKAKTKEIGLHAARDSGAIENSCGLLLGAWRPNVETIVLKILKNTRGKSGAVIECNFDGARMRITERERKEVP